MIIATLPHLGDRPFDPLGLVFAQATLGSIGGGNTKKMVQSLIAQAQEFGADAIVDVTTAMGDGGHCVMTGTAVKLR